MPAAAIYTENVGTCSWTYLRGDTEGKVFAAVSKMVRSEGRNHSMRDRYLQKKIGRQSMRHAGLDMRRQQCFTYLRLAVPLTKPSFLIEMAVLI